MHNGLDLLASEYPIELDGITEIAPVKPSLARNGLAMTFAQIVERHYAMATCE
jgi:hypothetical protein